MYIDKDLLPFCVLPIKKPKGLQYVWETQRRLKKVGSKTLKHLLAYTKTQRTPSNCRVFHINAE